MQKNEICETDIIGTAADGAGIGRVDGMVVFVPGAAEGDRLRVRIVKVLKNHAYGIIEEIISPSANRVDSDCAVSQRCGGCMFRHISYRAELEIKSRRTADAVKRIGGIDMEPQDIIAAESRTAYRNKAQFPVGLSDEARAVLGFYAPRSHRIIPCDTCLLQPEEFTAAATAFKEWIDRFKISVYDENSGEGLVRHLYMRKGFATGQVMVVAVINGKHIGHGNELAEMLRESVGDRLKSVQYNINTSRTNVVLGERCKIIFGQGYIEDILCGVRVKISPLSFYQVNRDMAERLYQKAAEYASPDGKTVLDLYCGAGTIGLSMAGRAKNIIGVEIVPQAVEDARSNAAANGIENAEFILGDAEAAANELKGRGIKPDVVVLDPPRKGCSPGLLRTVANDFSPERVVYVSCDPATLARDLKILCEFGYSLMEYTPADLFPGTVHVECVCLLTKNK